MAKAKSRQPVIMVMGTECPPEIAEEFNRWYSDKHVPDILKFPGVKKATRYKMVPQEALTHVKGTSWGENPQFLTIYEFEDWKAVEEYNKWPERKAISEDWNKNWAPKGAVIKLRIFYEPFKDRGK
ncbi:MAG: hypothetical protein HYX79_05460 [Chloroflexi bacterium]|nr:hypothetical protein [Chloroflexota bacterium]